MITGELKNKIDNLWLIFFSGGLTNPLDVIEQITYLMFIHDLDALENKHRRESVMLKVPFHSIFGDKTDFKWSTFRNFPPEKMYRVMQEGVFPFIKNLHGDKNSTYSKYMADAIFKIPTAQHLDSIVSALDDIMSNPSYAERDMRGDVYEYLLSKIATAGTNGQFRTPRHIIRMMVEMLDIKPNDIICDPACGTAGFLVAAGEYLKEKYLKEVFYNKQNRDHFNNGMFFGYDMDRTMLRIGAMNMMMHDIENPAIAYQDSLSDQNTKKNCFTKILANPPFKGSLNENIVSQDLTKVVKTKKTELLFLAVFLRMLSMGDRCATIVPDGVLFGASNAHKSIRKEIIDGNRLEARYQCA